MKLVWIALAICMIGLLVFSLVRRTRFAPHPRGQQQLPAVSPLPYVPRGGADHGVEGSYVATTLAGRHKDRIVARGLGKRGTVIAAVRTDGVLIDRSGAPTIFIPDYALTGVRRSDSVIVITWSHGDAALDTGLRIPNAEARDRLFDRISALHELKGNR